MAAASDRSTVVGAARSDPTPLLATDGQLATELTRLLTLDAPARATPRERWCRGVVHLVDAAEEERELLLEAIERLDGERRRAATWSLAAWLDARRLPLTRGALLSWLAREEA